MNKHLEEAYNIWKRNPGKSIQEVLSLLDKNQKEELVLNKFIFQVLNGGIDQWIGNGYGFIIQETIFAIIRTRSKHSETIAKILMDLYPFVARIKHPNEIYKWTDDNNSSNLEEFIEKYNQTLFDILPEFQEEIEQK